MFPKRVGLIVWVNDIRTAKNLERLGSLHYVSKRLKYVLLYINETDFRKTKSYLEKLSFVKKVELSYRKEITTDFSQTVLTN